MARTQRVGSDKTIELRS